MRAALAKGPILVVEDNESILGLLQIVLKSAGQEVIGISDGEAAYEAALSLRPRLILMDIQLPGMDGLELTRRLKADAATADIIVLAVSAYAMESDQRKAREAGCDGYISKPLDVNALPGIVSGYLDGTLTGGDGTGGNR
jgi:two-component system, cell cycle response regulator DivK